MNVDIIYGRFSPKRKALIDIATWPLFAIFVGVLLWQGYDIASEAIADLERSNSVWKAPLWPTKSLIPVAAILLLLQGVVRLWADVRTLMDLPNDPEIFGVPAKDETEAAQAAGGNS